MDFLIEHTTNYSYDKPVSQSINKCMMKPIVDADQQMLLYEMQLEPKTEIYHYVDYWHNPVQTFYIKELHDTLRITAKMKIRVTRTFPDSYKASQAEQQMSYEERQIMENDYAEYLCKTPYTFLTELELDEITSSLWTEAENMLEYVNRVNAYIYDHFSYESGATNVDNTAKDLVVNRKGVCQDFTHLMLAMCRYRGVPSRYISGYVYVGEDSAMRGDAATHAWVEAWIPGLGWTGFDPTNNIYALNQHIRLAVGRDYRDIVPVKGVYIGASHSMDVQVGVSLIDGGAM